MIGFLIFGKKTVSRKKKKFNICMWLLLFFFRFCSKNAQPPSSTSYELLFPNIRNPSMLFWPIANKPNHSSTKDWS